MTDPAFDAEFGKRLAAEWWIVYKWVCNRLNRTPEQAEDLTQFAIMQAWKNREGVKNNPKQNLRAYLLTIARNARYSEHRHEKCIGHSSLETDCYDADTDRVPGQFRAAITRSGGQYEGLRLNDAIHILANMPVEQVDAIVMLARGHTYEEAAAARGVPLGTIKSRVSRARRKLHAAEV